jgi:hypothetical protein
VPHLIQDHRDQVHRILVASRAGDEVESDPDSLADEVDDLELVAADMVDSDSWGVVNWRH